MIVDYLGEWKINCYVNLWELEDITYGIRPHMENDPLPGHAIFLAHKARKYEIPSFGLTPNEDIVICLPLEFSSKDIQGYIGVSIKCKELIEEFPNNGLVFLLDN